MEKRISTGRVWRLIGSPRVLAWLCALLLAAGTLPMYAISVYNHPYYDDFKFSAGVRQVWQQTHSLPAALAAAWEGAQKVRATWQGTYTGTLLSNLQPGVFSENMYWLTTVILLTTFLLGFGFLLWTLLRRVAYAGRSASVSVTCLVLFLMTQFLPGANEGFYWFNGGIGNTFIYAVLALAVGLLIRLQGARGGAAWLAAALVVCVTLLGGGSYGGGLFGLLCFGFATAYVWLRKRRFCWLYTALTLWFAICFAYNISAPGNAVRAAMIGAHPSAISAVLQSLRFGVALMGNQVTLPVVAVLLAASPLFYQLAQKSPYRFRHPVAVFFVGAALYCTQLTPPIYGGVFLGGTRITNTYAFSFLVLLPCYWFYALGAYARYRERTGAKPLVLAEYARRGLLIASACLFMTGCLGYKPNGETLYGPMHMSGGSAALSLLRGEAKQYDREMAAREALLNDPSRTDVVLAPLSTVPALFMPDLLASDSEANVLTMLAQYYQKSSVRVEGSVAP